MKTIFFLIIVCLVINWVVVKLRKEEETPSARNRESDAEINAKADALYRKQEEQHKAAGGAATPHAAPTSPQQRVDAWEQLRTKPQAGPDKAQPVSGRSQAAPTMPDRTQAGHASATTVRERIMPARPVAAPQLTAERHAPAVTEEASALGTASPLAPAADLPLPQSAVSSQPAPLPVSGDPQPLFVGVEASRLGGQRLAEKTTSPAATDSLPSHNVSRGLTPAPTLARPAFLHGESNVSLPGSVNAPIASSPETSERRHIGYRPIRK